MSGKVFAGVGAAAAAAGAAYFTMCPSAPSLCPVVAAAPVNKAFVFVKPHACTDQGVELVRDTLKAKGFKVNGEGDISSEDIDKKKLIDQHYYAIASKATLLQPSELNIPADKFQEKFGLDWADVLKQGIAYNALDGCKELNVDATGMAKLWAKCKKDNKLVKFGGGFYCGELETSAGKKIYVFNGFFMDMRNAFTAPGLKIHYFDVDWDAKSMPWAQFRGDLLGPTDPKTAPAESLRGQFLANWKKLGLQAEPNVGDNAVHASASPFEGMAERMNWLGAKCDDDAFCSALKQAGLSEKMINEWSVDPQVAIGDGKKKSIFDSLEDMDAAECLATTVKLSKMQ